MAEMEINSLMKVLFISDRVVEIEIKHYVQNYCASKILDNDSIILTIWMTLTLAGEYTYTCTHYY